MRLPFPPLLIRSIIGSDYKNQSIKLLDNFKAFFSAELVDRYLKQMRLKCSIWMNISDNFLNEEMWSA